MPINYNSFLPLIKSLWFQPEHETEKEILHKYAHSLHQNQRLLIKSRTLCHSCTSILENISIVPMNVATISESENYSCRVGLSN